MAQKLPQGGQQRQMVHGWAQVHPDMLLGTQPLVPQVPGCSQNRNSNTQGVPDMGELTQP